MSILLGFTSTFNALAILSTASSFSRILSGIPTILSEFFLKYRSKSSKQYRSSISSLCREIFHLAASSSSLSSLSVFCTSLSMVFVANSSLSNLLKPGFHMIVQIVPIVPVVSKNVQTIRKTETIAGFHMTTSKTEDAR